MNREIAQNSPFDAIRKISSKGVEFWMGRTLYPYLGYSEWDRFTPVIERARKACERSGENPDNHFRYTAEMVEIGSGARRSKEDCFLDRYACYLVAMNSDPSKSEVAIAQTYFAIQTRRQEITDGKLLTGKENRAEIRERVKTANKHLAATAKAAGVQNYALFHHAGHMGFYGMSTDGVKARKGIPRSDDLLDCVGSLELAAHEFKSQLAHKSIENKRIRGQHNLEDEHKRVSKVVRDTVHHQTGTFPEDLPAEPSLKKLGAIKRRALKTACPVTDESLPPSPQ